ncbi:hypothetical protein Cus16_0744 [Curtobacterium sp. ER1/6]|nr:hypothetical protein Cus16_0744 [Curtobacterium sp. ER1/6]
MLDARGVESLGGCVELVDGADHEAHVVEADRVRVETLTARCDGAQAEQLLADREDRTAVQPLAVLGDAGLVDVLAEVHRRCRAEQLLVEGLAAVDVGDGDPHVCEAEGLDDLFAHAVEPTPGTWAAAGVVRLPASVLSRPGERGPDGALRVRG